MKGSSSSQVGASRKATRVRLSDRTQRAYDADVRHFEDYGGKIPAELGLLERYLRDCAGFYSVGTLRRRLMAIRQAHVERGLPTLTDDPRIKSAMREVERRDGSAPRSAKPIRRRHLRKIVRRLDDSPRDIRDKALLLVGFAGAFRRSELVCLDIDDLDFRDEGLLIHLRGGASGQRGQGRCVEIPRARSALCAVSALRRWIRAANIKSGPVFQSFSRTGYATGKRLDAAYVSVVVKTRLTQVNVAADDYSAHSLRAGWVTEAAKAGVASWKIRQQIAHKSDATLARAIWDGALCTGSAAAAGRERRK